MAFKLKTGKTVNKILAGAGIAALAATVVGAISPNMASGTAGKVIPAVGAYLVGGIESVIGAAAAMMIGSSTSTFTGANSMGNLQEDSL